MSSIGRGGGRKGGKEGREGGKEGREGGGVGGRERERKRGMKVYAFVQATTIEFKAPCMGRDHNNGIKT